MNKKKPSKKKNKFKSDNAKVKLNVSVLGNPMLNKPERKKKT